MRYPSAQTGNAELPVPSACQLSSSCCSNRVLFHSRAQFSLRSSYHQVPSSVMPQSCPVESHQTAAAPQQAALGATANSPPKRRRVEWQWECPACGNKQPTGPRLLLHIHKCCGDLLPQACSLAVIDAMIAEEQDCQDTHQQQQHQVQPQGQASAAAQHQQPRHPMQQQQQHQQQQTDVSGSGPDDLQQWLSAASQQEHTLRMRALRLRCVDESKLAAADAEGDGLDSNSSPAGQPAAEQHQQVPAQHPPQAAAADGESRSAAEGDSAVSSGGSQAAAKKRGRLRSSGRTPVRTIEQIMQEMQLPKARVLRLLERAPRSIRLVADAEPLAVVYEDAHFLAVSKPPGLRSAPVHRFMGGSAVNRMIGYLRAEPYLLHRIDMDTSGVLVAAKDATTASQINAQFQAKLVSKAYLALCLGVPEQHSYTVDGPIGQHPDVLVARTVTADGQPAVTHVQVLAVSSSNPQDVSDTWGPAAAADPAARVKGAGCCLVCCRPVTGRTHQIRVHMAHAGHPLLGDDVYGLQGPAISRQALHAVSLTLRDPQSGAPLTFVAPLPQDFAAAAACLGLVIPPVQELAALSAVTQHSSTPAGPAGAH